MQPLHASWHIADGVQQRPRIRCDCSIAIFQKSFCAVSSCQTGQPLASAACKNIEQRSLTQQKLARHLLLVAELCKCLGELRRVQACRVDCTLHHTAMLHDTTANTTEDSWTSASC